MRRGIYMEWLRKKSVWFVGLPVVCLLGIGTVAYGYMHHNSKQSTPIIKSVASTTHPVFKTHVTPVMLAQFEKKVGQANWDKVSGTIDLFKVVDGMHFKLVSTTDPSVKKYDGSLYTITVGTPEYDGQKFPFVYRMQRETHNGDSSEPLITLNTLSAMGWGQYFEASGIPHSTVLQSLNNSWQYTFECLSSSQSGKTLIVRNFAQYAQVEKVSVAPKS